jgi:hypothetical protein
MSENNNLRIRFRNGNELVTSNEVESDSRFTILPMTLEIVSYDRPLTYSDVYSSMINQTTNRNSNSQNILYRSLYEGGLKRNPILQLDLNDHYCRPTEVDNDCTICSTKFSLGNKLTTLETCNHTFHFSCLEEWGKYKQECPLCRNPIPILER